MSGEGWSVVAVSSALVVVGAAAWTLHLTAPLEADAGSLSALPQQFQGWRGRDLPLEDGVARMLGADFNLQRAYLHPTGSLVFLYLGYYGTARGGAPEHTPWACYPANGWTIETSRTVEIDPARGLSANELVVADGQERRLVHFWYRSSRRTGMRGRASLIVEHVLGRFRDGRADGALVRISTRLAGEDETGARTRLLSFGAALDPMLEEIWPAERRPS